MVIGIDVGDKTSRCRVLGGNGEVVPERSVATTNESPDAEVFRDAPSR
jgi:hypothetical protein